MLGGGPPAAVRRGADRGDARRRRPPGRRREGGPRDPRRTPPRAVPDRRPATCSGSPTSPTSARACPGSPTPPSRRPWRSAAEAVRGPSELDEAPTRIAIVAMGRYGGFELSYGSDADVLFVHDPEDGVDQHEAASYAQAVANELRRLLVAARPRPAAGGRRRPAARGQAGPAGAHAGVVRRLLREVVEGLGGAGAAARRRGRRRPRPAAPVRGADRPAAVPRGRASPRTTSSRCAGSRPASTRSGCRAAPTRRATSSSAAAGSPTSSGPCSCCRCGTPARCRACAPRAPSRRSTRRARRACSSEADATVLVDGWRTVSRVRNAVTLVAGSGSDQLPSDTRERAAVAVDPRLPGRARPTRWSTTCCAPCGSRAASWTGCSGDDGQPPCAGCRLPLKLRVHQQEALAALAGAWAAGRRRAWVALPPGAGKTLVGLETIRDRVARGRGRQGRRARPQHRDPGPVGALGPRPRARRRDRPDA